MKIDGIPFRSIWLDETDGSVKIIDQTRLPHFFEVRTLDSLADACYAIAHMQVRGAPLIGATAAWGLYLALRNGETDLVSAGKALVATRPTAVNLVWAVNRMLSAIGDNPVPTQAVAQALNTAQQISDEDVSNCRAIGEWGAGIIQQLADANAQAQTPVNILTHCNAGWLATVDRGTALAPVYQAWEAGVSLHVWVDETRPRNQGASLTAWELLKQGIPHTVISDNTGGHLMQTGRVDLCLVGSDRTTFRGNVCNKIGTYLKALAAFDNNVPFYAAVPLSSIDWHSDSIPIEERDSGEITHIQGLNTQGVIDTVRLTPTGSRVLNPGFDITPGRLVSGLITEHGIVEASQDGLGALKAMLQD